MEKKDGIKVEATTSISIAIHGEQKNGSAQ